jgi:hypothetical protein
MRQPAQAYRLKVSDIRVVAHAAAALHIAPDPFGVKAMRTTLTEQGSDRRGGEACEDQREVARDNPRRRRESHDEREDEHQHGNGTIRSPLRHGVQYV